MAKRKGRLKSGEVRMDFYGTAELIKQIDDVGGKVEDAIIQAIKESVPPIQQQMQEEMSKHTKPSGKGYSRGPTKGTYGSMTTEPIKKEKNGVIKTSVGYIRTKANRFQGNPAIFWNVGGAHIEPTFFIDKARDDNIDKVANKQREVLERLLQELKGGK